MLEKWLDKRYVLAIVFDLRTLTPNGGEFYDGALETLEAFRKARTKMGLVALESNDWTKLTLGQLGVGEHCDHVEIVNRVDPYYDNIGPQDWKNAFGALGIWPQNGIVVGGGLPEDIYKIGVRYCVRVSRDGEMHSSSKKPEGTIIVESIAGVASALLAAV